VAFARLLWPLVAGEEEVLPDTVVDRESDGTVDLSDDQLGVMTCSMSSATSGFDDVSCASSVADVEEMPSEETWNFDVQEEKVCQNRYQLAFADVSLACQTSLYYISQ